MVPIRIRYKHLENNLFFHYEVLPNLPLRQIEKTKQIGKTIKKKEA